MIEAAGADYFNVTADGYNDYWRVATAEQLLFPEPPSPLMKEFKNTAEPGTWVAPLGAAIKQVVSVPVGVVGRLDAELGEKIIEAGQADFLIMGRRLLADQQYPQKIAAGPQGRRAALHRLHHLRDPHGGVRGAGLPGERGHRPGLRAASSRLRAVRKKVVVVGGGPAGMEAARVAAMRGHDVTLYEKEAYLGGLLNMAALVKGTEIFDLRELVDYFEGQLDELGVKVKLGRSSPRRLPPPSKPDVIVVAAGGVPDTLDIPGIDGGNVHAGRRTAREGQAGAARARARSPWAG